MPEVITTGNTIYRQAQIGKETTAGSAVTPTYVMLDGKMSGFKENRTIRMPQEDNGLLARNSRAYTAAVQATGSWDAEVSYEDIMIWLAGGIKGGVSPTTASSVSTWVYTPSMSAPNAPTTYTIIYGDNVEAEKANYVVPTELNISGAIDEPWKLKASLVGQTISSPASFAAISPTAPGSSPEIALMNKSKIYIDAYGGTVGTTQLTGTLISFDWKLTTGFVPDKTADNALGFTKIVQDKSTRKLTLDLVAEFQKTDTSDKGILNEKSHWKNNVPRIIRIETIGSAVGASNKAIKLDTYVLYTDVSALEERNGISTVRIQAEAAYNSTATTDMKVTVINGVSAFPL